MTSVLPVRSAGVSTATSDAPDGPATFAATTRSRGLGDARRRRLVVVGDVVSAVVVLGLLAPFSTATPLHEAFLVAAWLVALAATGGYDATRVPFWPDEARRVWSAALGLAAVVPLAGEAIGGPINHVGGSTVTAALFAAGTTATRWVLRAVTAVRSGGRVGALRVVVAGHDRDVSRIVSELAGGRFRGYDVVDVCDLPVAETGSLAEVVHAVHRCGADALVVAPCRHLDAPALRRLSWHLEQSSARLIVSTSLLDVSAGRTRLAHAGGLPLVSLRQARIRGGLRVVKDVSERVLASLALVVLSPLLLALAVVVRIDSSGPALFRQQRVGRDGVAFQMLKFRTMRQDAEALRPELESLASPSHVLFKLREDPRITRIGGFLRRYSLDELPQLVNVARGSMSLVGPRPPLPDEVARYEPDVLRRLTVKPGITGLWQVSGRSDLTWEDSVRLDLRYVDNWSLRHDWWIMARTVGAVLGHRGAY